MKAKLVGVIAAVLLMTAATFAQTFIKETPIFESDVPVVVREVFKAAYPQASADRYIKVEVNGVPFYRVESVEASTHRNILYDQNGTVSRIAERIVVADLPASAQQVIPEKYPKSKISSTERVTEAGRVTYEVKVKQDAKMFDLQFDAEGKLTATREVKVEIVVTRVPF
jgi:Putative beta-lactamase-inhibitor-like, PepSY-like